MRARMVGIMRVPAIRQRIEIINTRLRSVKCETITVNRVLWTSRTQHGDGMSLNQRVEGDHTTQGTSTTHPPPLVLVQTPHPRPLA